MLNPPDLHDTDLLEGPASQSLGELAVERGNLLLLTNLLDLCIEPLVLQHLCRANNGESRRVAGLEGGDKSKLLAGSKQVINHLGLLFRVVAVCGARGTEDGGEESAASQSMSNTARESKQLVLAAAGEEVLQAWSEWARRRQSEHIMQVGSARGIVVEVVHDEASSVGRELDIELEKEGVDGGGSGLAGAEGQEDVAVGIDEVKEDLGSQVGTKTY